MRKNPRNVVKQISIEKYCLLIDSLPNETELKIIKKKNKFRMVNRVQQNFFKKLLCLIRVTLNNVTKLQSRQ